MTALSERREALSQEWFGGRYWRVLTEATGTRVSPDGHTVTYSGGFFRVTPPAVFATPFGHKGRSGYLIRELTPYGEDHPGGVVAAFGRASLLAAPPGALPYGGPPARDPALV